MKRILQVLKWIRRAVLLLIAIYSGLALVGSFIYFFIEPSTSSVEFIKTVFELSLWLAVPILIIALILGAWRLSVITMIVTLLFLLIYVPWFIPRTPDVDESAPLLTVMTFNLKTTSEGIVDVIRAANADVVALQELSQDSARVLEELEDVYPYQALHPQVVEYNGQGILSRYPIQTDEYWEYPQVPHTMGHQRVEIHFASTTIIVYNTHPWPPLEWETGSSDESHRVVLRDIAERAFAEDLPLLLLGDFNMTNNFAEYDLLASRYTDSYRVAGNSRGYTYPNYRFEPFPALLRLDYIWHSHHFESVEAEVWAQHGESDHSPVVGTLALSQASS